MACDERGSLTFRDSFGHDVNDSKIWLDLGAFGEVLDIDGHKILGVMTRAREYGYERRGETERYSHGGFVLYVRSAEISNVTAGQQVKINGAKYAVKSRGEMLGQMRRIEIEAVDP